MCFFLVHFIYYSGLGQTPYYLDYILKPKMTSDYY